MDKHPSIRIECPEGFKIHCHQVDARLAEIQLVPIEKKRVRHSSTRSINFGLGLSIRFETRDLQDGPVIQPVGYMRLCKGVTPTRNGFIKSGYTAVRDGMAARYCKFHGCDYQAFMAKFPTLDEINKFGLDLVEELNIPYREITK